jgi:predicted dehydrogenase
MLPVAVIAARARRQGIGGHVARTLQRVGAEVAAVAGTSRETVEEARRALGGGPRGYLSVAELLAREPPLDAVAICSPADCHREHLELVAGAGLACLCEKPLWWGPATDRAAETARLVDAFGGRTLMLLAQWPFTLPAFHELHPGARGRVPGRFEMWLGPVSRGPEMVLDSASHPISLLQALCGAGEVARPRARFRASEDLELEFEWRHAAGATEARLALRTCERPPRPAGYALDGLRAERRVALPAYEQSFHADARSVPVPDPLALLVAAFLRRVRERAGPDRNALIEGVVALERLHDAARAAS